MENERLGLLAHDIGNVTSNLHLISSAVEDEPGGKIISESLAVLEKELMRIASEIKKEA